MSAVLKSADDAFWTDVFDRIVASMVPVLLLERWARGAGMRSWYLLQGADDVAVVRRLLRPGAGLTAYFAISFSVVEAAEPDRWSRAAALIQELGPNDELLAFARSRQEPALDVDYLSTTDELSEWLNREPSAELWLCPYPDWPSDGREALTAVVPDEDGLARDHPY